LQRASGIDIDLIAPPADAIGVERPVLTKPAPASPRAPRPNRAARRRGLPPRASHRGRHTGAKRAHD
jgi:hypothetical protein